MKKILMAVCLVGMVSSLYSAPTHESLLRNSGNKDFEGNAVVLKVEIKKEIMSSESAVVDKEKKDSMINEVMMDKSVFLKLVFYKDHGAVELLQTIHNSAAMDDKKSLRVVHTSSLEKTIRDEGKIDRAVFYALMTSLLLNDSSSFVQLIKKYEPLFKTNEEQLDQDKVKIYEDYRQYLLAIKENDGKKIDKPSPLAPESAEEKMKVDQLLRGTLYKESEGISLFRESGEFYWQLQLPNFLALVTTEQRELRKIKIKGNDQEIESLLEDYTIYDSSTRFPSAFIFKDGAGNHYKVTTLSLNVFTNKSGKLFEKVKAIQAAVDELNKTQKEKRAVSLEATPSFVY